MIFKIFALALISMNFSVSAMIEEDQKKIELELRRLIGLQSANVTQLEYKLRTRSAQLGNLGSDIGQLRANIRNSLRTHVFENRSVLTNGNFAIVSSRIYSSLPTYASLSFSMYEIGEMKNRQGRLRLLRGSFENLNREYVRASLELERLKLLQEMLKEGEEITAQMIKKPSSFLNDDESDNDSGKSENDRTNNSGKIVFGLPHVGDEVTPKSKGIYLLKNLDEAENLQKQPSMYSVQKLVAMADNNQAGKLDAGEVAKVLEEEEHLLKLQITSLTSPFKNFIGWIDKHRVLRFRQESANSEPDNISNPKNPSLPMVNDLPKEKPIPKGIIKLAGLPAVGNTITAKDIAIVWKNSVDLKDYVNKNEDLDIRDAAKERRELKEIDDTVVARVIKVDQIGKELIYQINIESPKHPLNRTKWWVRKDDVVMCR